MSHIPNSAMPHAGPQPGTDEKESEASGRFARVAEVGSGLADMVREHPKTAAAAGAAVAGLVAAAAIPALRARGRSDGKAASGAGKGSGKKG